MGLVIVLFVRLLGRSRRKLGLGNRRVLGMRLVLVRDFRRRLPHRLAGGLIARIRVARERLADDVVAGRNLRRTGRHLGGGEGGARNGLVAASVGTLAMAVAAAIATVAAAMVIVGFVIVARGARVGLDQRLPVGDWDLVIVRMNFGKRQEAVA